MSAPNRQALAAVKVLILLALVCLSHAWIVVHVPSKAFSLACRGCSSSPRDISRSLFGKGRNTNGDNGATPSRMTSLENIASIKPPNHKMNKKRYKYKNKYHNYSFLQRLLESVILDKFRSLKTWIRLRITERHTVYVMECQDQKWYIGSTSYRKKRFQQHFSDRGGSSWNRLYPVIRVAHEFRRVPPQYSLGLEAQVTAEYMLKYGVNQVRGAMFSETRNYTTSDVQALTGFLGHYNQLQYRELESELIATLPQPSPQAITAKQAKQRARRSTFSNSKTSCKKGKSTNRASRRMATSTTGTDRDDDHCFRCGEKGHWAHDCPEEKNKAGANTTT
jgi:predicted GIY-YIG superfamily endonuclease